MFQRAFSDLTIRSIDAEKRIIRGVATSPRVDRVSDIIEPLGCTFRNPAILLLQHSHDRPVGTVVFDKPTETGVTFTAHIPQITEPGILKDRTDEAWQSVRARILRHVSIGFRPVGNNAVEPLPNGGLRYRRIEIFELSLVSVPAQPDAEILEVRATHQRPIDARVSGAGHDGYHRVVKLDPVVRAGLNGTLKIHTAPRNKPGEPFKIHKIKRGPHVVQLPRELCPWLDRSRRTHPVVKLPQRDLQQPRHRVVKLGPPQ